MESRRGWLELSDLAGGSGDVEPWAKHTMIVHWEVGTGPVFKNFAPYYLLLV